jgi:hypothetical protein
MALGIDALEGEYAVDSWMFENSTQTVCLACLQHY